MPRDGSGIYSIPPGTQGAPNTTIESAKYNAYIADVEADLNAPRPIIAGGTGGNSPAAARAALAAERSMQVVTNYDSMVWEAGSFYSAIGATSAPVAGHAFAGIVYGPDANNLVIEARDLNDTATPGIKYVKEKTAGVWAPAWMTEGSDKVAKAGDTMTGDLTITKVGPALTLDRTDAPGSASIIGKNNGSTRWTMYMGINAETGGNAGSDFALNRYSDAGALIDSAFVILRNTNRLRVAGDPINALDVSTKQYADKGVRTDMVQAFTPAQQAQARSNIYAAGVDAHGWQNLLVNPSFEIAQVYGLNTAIACANGSNTFVADQWQFVTNGGAPFTVACQNYQVAGALGVSRMLNITCNGAAAYTGSSSVQIYQSIEGQRAARLNWGTSGGTPMTVCLMVYGTIAGTAVLAVRNAAGTRSYCTPITINNPGTYEYKTVTIPPDTDNSAYWNDSRAAMFLSLSFGVGPGLWAPTPNAWSNGNFIGLAGITNFFATNGNVIRVPAFGAFSGPLGPLDIYQFANSLRDFAVEQALCKRYWQKAFPEVRFPGANAVFEYTYAFEEMRASPTTALMTAGTQTNINTATFVALSANSLRVLIIAGAGAEVIYNGNVISLDARI